MAENIEKVKRYQVIEDNGGGLTLVTFDGNGNVDYFNSQRVRICAILF